MNKDDHFYNLETVGGILLFFTAILAIILANSPLSSWYSTFLEIPVKFSFGTFTLNKPLLLWINDGLMAIYFLLVGLEIKREIKRGVLSSRTSIFIPAITALCGLLVPAGIFIFFNYHNPTYIKGWAIPTATDIAFTLGILSILGSRVPFSLKILLTAIAIFDDIAAIVIIAIFYTQKLSILSLTMAVIFTATLIIFNYFDIKKPALFIIIGIALWIAVLKSGVHATLAGIVLAMTIPDTQEKNSEKPSMLVRVEDGLHPWVVFLILPMFALANAGVSFMDIGLDLFIYPVVIGISLGLFLGKQIGIFLPLWYFLKRKAYLQIDKINMLQVYGLALICGVGFTMSLFIGSLAYQNEGDELIKMVKIGVIMGSFFSGLFGYIVLRYAGRKA